MSDREDDQPPKIIVDESWKEQVEREKEALREQQQQAQANSEAPDSLDDFIPEASFSVLVSLLGTQAMSALGLLADPQTGEAIPNRRLAKHFIDLIGTLEEKTNGNLSSDEAQVLRESLHQLRMLYVTMANQPHMTDNGEGEPAQKSSSPIIQLP